MSPAHSHHQPAYSPALAAIWLPGRPPAAAAPWVSDVRRSASCAAADRIDAEAPPVPPPAVAPGHPEYEPRPKPICPSGLESRPNGRPPVLGSESRPEAEAAEARLPAVPELTRCTSISWCAAAAAAEEPGGSCADMRGVSEKEGTRRGAMSAAAVAATATAAAAAAGPLRP